MKDKDNWQKMCQDIQDRVWQVTPYNVKNSKLLRTQILKCLTTAYNQGKLKTKLNEIHDLLKLNKSIKHGKKVWEITGGQRNFKRRKDIPHFERLDQCWFDFAILINETPKPAEIIGFNFEIRFPQSCPTKFIRYDLNLPEHNNEERGLRFHIHPGNDDFMIPSSPMSPLEILHLFLYGLQIPESPRLK